MTTLDAQEAREAIFARDGWRCVACGRPIRLGQPQLAHRIPQTKAMIKHFGVAVIHHPLNLASACSLKCNDAIDIRGWPYLIRDLAKKIEATIDGGAGGGVH